MSGRTCSEYENVFDERRQTCRWEFTHVVDNEVCGADRDGDPLPPRETESNLTRGSEPETVIEHAAPGQKVRVWFKKDSFIKNSTAQASTLRDGDKCEPWKGFYFYGKVLDIRGTHLKIQMDHISDPNGLPLNCYTLYSRTNGAVFVFTPDVLLSQSN